LSPKYETCSDIVAGIQEGDRRAEAAFVKKYRQPVMYLLEKRAVDRERAQDLAHDAMWIVLQKLRGRSIKEPDKLSSYLYKTAINLHIGEVRKEVRHNTKSDSDLIEMLSGPDDDQYLSLIRERTGDTLKRLFEELNNDRDREILILCYLEERDKEEICEKLKLSHRHFDRVIFRARTRFRELVIGNQEEIPLEL